VRPWLKVFAVLLAVAVAVPALASGWKALLSPGPMAKAHAEHAGNCDQCHLVYDGIPDEKCLKCHEGLSQRITAGKGYHATVDSQPCIECHTDHLGADASITQAAALAAFDHAKAGFALDGPHAKVTCDTCHTAPVAEMTSVCIECHADDDPHASGLGPECGACHTASSWPAGLKAKSAHVTPMDGGHAAPDCVACHTGGENVADVVPCAACHPEAHGGTISPCEQCHSVAGWVPGEFDHGPCTCTFAGAHQTAACLDCHPGFVFTATPTKCSACHERERKHEPLGECSQCHEATTWSDSTFVHNVRSKFAIDGEHLTVDCAGCHTTGTFRGTPMACAGCHAARGEEAHGDFGACDTCHATSDDGFRDSPFDHATTGFALTGRHTGLKCKDCHPAKAERYPGGAP